MLRERLLGTLEARLNRIGRRFRRRLCMQGRERQGACRHTEYSPHRRNRKPSWPVAIIAQEHSTGLAAAPPQGRFDTRLNAPAGFHQRGIALASAVEGLIRIPKGRGIHIAQTLTSLSACWNIACRSVRTELCKTLGRPLASAALAIRHDIATRK